MTDISVDVEVLLRTRKFDVVRKFEPKGGGKSVTREIVIHPGAVVILPILDDKHIVMIRNTRVAAGQELWELPAGTLEPKETPLETARRELEEETGYKAEQFTSLGNFFTSPGVMNEVMHVFVATNLIKGEGHLDEGEKIQVEIVEIARVRQMLINLELRDGKTIATLGLYFLGASKIG
ncbi:MAG: NUDIX hydrolase [Planctomycetes bacterium]|nr:NUDIX hydrolase [Planctomycetota bacterium]MBI3833548.1 NUDIX hydrolase [Planctomycetota bacterium]